jgi:hypothetical protein
MSGKPIQSALWTPSQSTLPRIAANDVADHHPGEHRQPRDEALQRDADQQDRHQRDHRDPGLLGELVLGDRGEVEADQRDDRARHHRRQEELDHAVAGAVDDQADDDQHEAGAEDAAERRRHAAVRLGGDHRRDEREARAGVGRHAVARDQVEQDRPDAGEEDGRRDREAGQHRHQRGRPNIASTCWAPRPSMFGRVQPLVGYDLAGPHRASHRVQFQIRDPASHRPTPCHVAGVVSCTRVRRAQRRAVQRPRHAGERQQAAGQRAEGDHDGSAAGPGGAGAKLRRSAGRLRRLGRGPSGACIWRSRPSRNSSPERLAARRRAAGRHAASGPSRSRRPRS